MTFMQKMQRYERVLSETIEATKDHPLTEHENRMLADMIADGCLDAAVVINWLEATSRISPRERKVLLTMCEREMEAKEQ